MIVGANVIQLPVDYVVDPCVGGEVIAALDGWRLISHGAVCILSGPDYRFPPAWVEAHLPAGEWEAGEAQDFDGRFHLALHRC